MRVREIDAVPPPQPEAHDGGMRHAEVLDLGEQVFGARGLDIVETISGESLSRVDDHKNTHKPASRHTAAAPRDQAQTSAPSGAAGAAGAGMGSGGSWRRSASMRAVKLSRVATMKRRRSTDCCLIAASMRRPQSGGSEIAHVTLEEGSYDEFEAACPPQTK